VSLEYGQQTRGVGEVYNLDRLPAGSDEKGWLGGAACRQGASQSGDEILS